MATSEATSRSCCSGVRLNGGWVLVRMRRDDRGRAQWLLIKHRDETATEDYDVVAEVDTSVTTGRTMDEITAGAPRKAAAKKSAVKKSAGKKTAAKRERATS